MTRTKREHIDEIMQAALLSIRYCVAKLADATACDCGRYVWDAAAGCWLCYTEGGGTVESDEATCMACRCNMTRDGRVWQPGVMQLPDLEDQEAAVVEPPNFGEGLFRAMSEGVLAGAAMYRQPRCLGDILDDMDEVAGSEVAPHQDTSMAGVG
jgi:hypothetical protein